MASHHPSSMLMIAAATLTAASLDCVGLDASRTTMGGAHTAPTLTQAADRERRTLVVVIVETPFLLLPDADREPLRILEAGTVLTLLDEDPGWYHVEFQDFHYGRRVGYVQKRDAVAVDVQEQSDDTSRRDGTR